MTLPAKVREIMAKGVRIAAPFSVEIGAEVSVDRISGQEVVFYSGTKIYGAQTLISAGVKIGAEGPVTVVDCQLGRRVELNGGFFQSSVFLDKASLADGAHVREGTLLEEETKVGHTVGLKQTILFPFVTLGSLINFCDCLMAGGTSRNDHSEVGSSYVHFNYTPQQDKATPSLIGEVPRGVMLDQPPIFLGGQGGMVGPLRIDYGTVITAGTVWRRDSAGAKLLHGGEGRPLRQDYQAGSYGDIRRKVYNNIVYIANLLALQQWYVHVRSPFFRKREMGEALMAGALDLIESAIGERIKQLQVFSERMHKSVARGKSKGGGEEDILRRQLELAEKWPELEACFQAPLEAGDVIRYRDTFLDMFLKQGVPSDDYIAVIKALNADARQAGTQWLQRIVDLVSGRALAVLPSFQSLST
jgi:bifunctional UDP-N-acetylglucosamine pyrophosphorylase/glucosamine-1-phosphate N-acetyltransferase